MSQKEASKRYRFIIPASTPKLLPWLSEEEPVS